MIRIIDYKAGNAPSVMHAVKHLGYNAEFARTPKDLNDASHIILPGVGTAKATIDSLKELELLPKLEEAVHEKNIPFLGICVGMQILFEHSEEDGATGLGWLNGKIVKYDTKTTRVPQMGWNLVRYVKDTPLVPKEHDAPDYFYFVNSYHAKPADKSDIWAVSDYNGEFVAAVQRGNIYATQFHTEKSGEAGLNLLKCFISTLCDTLMPGRGAQA